MKIFTIIKEESKRIPDKNFVDINGLPLWRYLLSELDGLDVTVNTDSQKFLKEFQRSNLKSIKVLKENKNILTGKMMKEMTPVQSRICYLIFVKQ